MTKNQLIDESIYDGITVYDLKYNPDTNEFYQVPRGSSKEKVECNLDMTLISFA